jgi:hypothetical protein
LHPVFFAPIDGDLIKKNALRTSGGAGVSQQEDALWHKMISGHKDTSATLANALASVARRLVTEFVDPAGLEALLANRGIAIDKCPGLRPVGVGEMAADNWQSSDGGDWLKSAGSRGRAATVRWAPGGRGICHSRDERLPE